VVTQGKVGPATTCWSSAWAARVLHGRPDRQALWRARDRDVVQRSEASSAPGRSARTSAINYKTNPQWARPCSTPTDKRGADVVIENVGAATWKDSIRLAQGRRRLVTCGDLGTGRETLIPLVFWKQVHIIGSTMANRKNSTTSCACSSRGLSRRSSTRSCPQGRRRRPGAGLAEGKQFGKIVLTRREQRMAIR